MPPTSHAKELSLKQWGSTPPPPLTNTSLNQLLKTDEMESTTHNAEILALNSGLRKYLSYFVEYDTSILVISQWHICATWMGA